MIVHLPTDPLFLGIRRRGSKIAIGIRPPSVREMDAYLIDTQRTLFLARKYLVPTK
jgi:hypothetical protein